MNMKYLIYFRPNKELSDLIIRQKCIILPESGLHSTLCFFYMEPEQEGSLISDLHTIKFSPIEIKTQDFSDFDKDSLVLKLNRPNELLQLHKNIILAVRNYANLGFSEIAEQYFGNKYNPHLTISKSSSGFDRNLIELIGQRDLISRYYLSKKNIDNWKEIHTFYSRE